MISPTAAGLRTSPRQRRAQTEAQGAPTDQRRRASAGRILAVGVGCFLIWLLFDANQLYRSAQAGQIGVRRTVAVSILRPIAAVTNALHLSGPVNTANTELGTLRWRGRFDLQHRRDDPATARDRA